MSHERDYAQIYPSLKQIFSTQRSSQAKLTKGPFNSQSYNASQMSEMSSVLFPFKSIPSPCSQTSWKLWGTFQWISLGVFNFVKYLVRVLHSLIMIIRTRRRMGRWSKLHYLDEYVNSRICTKSEIWSRRIWLTAFLLKGNLNTPMRHTNITANKINFPIYCCKKTSSSMILRIRTT